MYTQAEKIKGREKEELDVVSNFMTHERLIINLHATESLKRLLERIKLKEMVQRRAGMKLECKRPACRGQRLHNRSRVKEQARS